MTRMHSPRTQCCCCAGNIFFMLFGILMMSTGASLVLNYGQLEVDTGGLPPEWHNEEGKKIVGIILLCCGFVSMGISALMGALYFTVCSRPKPPRNSITPRSLNGVKTPRDNKLRTKSRDKGVSVSDPTINTTAGNYSTEVHQPRPNSSKYPKRSRKKRSGHNLKHGMYKSRLPPHSEYDEAHCVLREDIEMTDSLRSVDSSLTESSEPRRSTLDINPKPTVIISVTSLNPSIVSESQEGCFGGCQPGSTDLQSESQGYVGGCQPGSTDLQSESQGYFGGCQPGSTDLQSVPVLQTSRSHTDVPQPTHAHMSRSLGHVPSNNAYPETLPSVSGSSLTTDM